MTPAPLRLNLGCGLYPLAGYVNLDADPTCCPDVIFTVPPIPYQDCEVSTIYMGHLLEHYSYDHGQALLHECYRVLIPGGQLSVVVPDTRAILGQYIARGDGYARDSSGRVYLASDLDDVCAYWLYSTIQPSHHAWSYDRHTLARALVRAGFVHLTPIDRDRDPRLSDPGWWQLGITAERPHAA